MSNNYHGMTTPQLRAKCAELQKEIDRLKGQGNTTGDPYEGREPRFASSQTGEQQAFIWFRDKGLTDDFDSPSTLKIANHIAALEDKIKGLRHSERVKQEVIESLEKEKKDLTDAVEAWSDEVYELKAKVKSHSLSRRDQFAKAAMNAYIAKEGLYMASDMGGVSSFLKMADTVIKALDAKESPEQPKDLQILWDLVETWKSSMGTKTVTDIQQLCAEELQSALQSLLKGYSRERVLLAMDQVRAFHGACGGWPENATLLDQDDPQKAERVFEWEEVVGIVHHALDGGYDHHAEPGQIIDNWLQSQEGVKCPECGTDTEYKNGIPYCYCGWNIGKAGIDPLEEGGKENG